ncbi:nucleotide sugar dehydrogenase family protein [Burkholderia ambifaria AMMD]|uniref:UDP-glucose 6-dehydrogenase n=1 Tax=Burkholderia ambifaria (strain ATCC BAA-244 / DSM 16087 / CCUG 44356 / LMG 19182 / AMMD) TaxID=339670 RepID=Q0BH87_BURCM|nr:UDP-glucose/GDP-mannose dehydrogenase family protein [Burkholderia ambifaria]ABI86486.1 UDP-glucose 6-dehydrogenase [Burkholderia ambifaria AMMD]AJY20776.1 nucleotide sugar dehydrogenase family protein [Burkholderia ambifaria AMMD]MBR7929895.1 UDP-glucose/GDP-mannose dehydrogenase family protein [Burkholderia ambifaria]PEH66226.1 UDP-glucose/GDP-mannose dehydrogenase family protein [Burkholderia ambifaria]QQC03184.1 UDP-glucose/GDP-mannose dehydrogenase family protein [Burkholderia ambifari
MKITIIGAGYVGLVTGSCLAEIGHDVFCLDVDQRKIDILNNGGMPIHEPGLLDIIARNRAAGRLRFSTDIAASVAHGEIQFIAVGTPPDEDGSADLQYVLEAARNIGRHMTSFKVIVDKSTVPVGTAQRVHAVVDEALGARGLAGSVAHRFSVVSNPEFLKEGAAVEDFMRPDRIIIGVDDDETGTVAREKMKKLYAPFNRNHERTIYMDVRSAEFAKYAANAMLATRISFMNEMSNLADKVGADIEAVRRGIGSDPRIGYHFLYAGVGYGGSCFPKDVQALIRTAGENGQPLRILEAVEAANSAQKDVLIGKIEQRFGADLTGREFAVWGLAFKPNTDDMREAPSRRLIAALLDRGATVRAYDPVAIDEARRVFALDLGEASDALARLHFVDTQDAAVIAADALVIVTEWKEFRSPDFTRLKAELKAPVIFDGRNLYEPDAMAELGIDYHAIGRPHVAPQSASRG